MHSELIVDNLYRDLVSDKTGSKDEFNSFFRFSLANGNTLGIQAVAGFRPKSRHDINKSDITNCAFCVVYTTYQEKDWPDNMNYETGIFTYYGDNKKPGTSIDDTKKVGNIYLKYIFEKLHNDQRKNIQPVLCFEKIIIKKGESKGSYMRFLGLAAPGGKNLEANNDLVAVWRTKEGERFQNYESKFTILNETTINRKWLEDMVNGIPSYESKFCPDVWKNWIYHKDYNSIGNKS